ncbi:MAG TPA: winged helix-turn-helix domain-containing protein [bacterium]|nr:winged helix-turn-helix domain-containing protein [bacterium]
MSLGTDSGDPFFRVFHVITNIQAPVFRLANVLTDPNGPQPSWTVISCARNETEGARGTFAMRASPLAPAVLSAIACSACSSPDTFEVVGLPIAFFAGLLAVGWTGYLLLERRFCAANRNRILSALRERSKTWTELARELDLNLILLHGTLDRLVKDGVIQREWRYEEGRLLCYYRLTILSVFE